jgi:hypothetical protein
MKKFNEMVNNILGENVTEIRVNFPLKNKVIWHDGEVEMRGTVIGYQDSEEMADGFIEIAGEDGIEYKVPYDQVSIDNM